MWSRERLILRRPDSWLTELLCIRWYMRHDCLMLGAIQDDVVVNGNEDDRMQIYTQVVHQTRTHSQSSATTTARRSSDILLYASEAIYRA